MSVSRSVPAPAQRPAASLPLMVLALCGTASVLGLGWAMVATPANVGQLALPAVVLGLFLAAALIWALPGPTFAGQPLAVDWLGYGLLLAGAALALFAIQAATGNPLQFLLVYAAVEAAVVWWLRASISRREVAYAAALALVAGAAGLGSGRNAAYMPLPIWAVLNIGLTFFGFLGGWALMRRVGLLERGMGEVWLLTKGPRRALRGVLEGVLLSLPFTAVGVALGMTATETWVRDWWQTLVALQPGIAEEAWSRVFLFSALMCVLLRGGSLRAAWLGAVVVGVYWFLSLHNYYLQVGGLAALTSTLMAGTLFGLPMAYVWLRRGLEAAIGFHFAMDFGKFLMALLLSGLT